jgi:hypothetical protein
VKITLETADSGLETGEILFRCRFPLHIGFNRANRGSARGDRLVVFLPVIKIDTDGLSRETSSFVGRHGWWPRCRVVPGAVSPIWDGSEVIYDGGIKIDRRGKTTESLSNYAMLRILTTLASQVKAIIQTGPADMPS